MGGERGCVCVMRTLGGGRFRESRSWKRGLGGEGPVARMDSQVPGRRSWRLPWARGRGAGQRGWDRGSGGEAHSLWTLHPVFTFFSGSFCRRLGGGKVGRRARDNLEALMY